MIVVDSAAIVDALVIGVDANDLRNKLATEELHAPALLDFEVVSALRGLTIAGHLTAHRAEDALIDFNDLPVQRWHFAYELQRRAFQLRCNISAYDAAYITLAEALDCPLLTRDVRLSRAPGHNVRVEVL